LIMNRLRGIAKVAAVKSPGYGDNMKANMQDIAVITGGQFVSKDLGVNLENVTLDMLGQARKVSITKDDTIVLDGRGTKEEIQERVEIMRDAMESASAYEKEKLQERMARLTSGVAVLKIGGGSEVEVGEKKDRVNDALNATRAAVEEGIVPGGGCSLLYSTLSLNFKEAQNFDQEHGMKIVKNALRIPAKSIADNSGLEGAVVIGKLLDQAKGNSKSTFGLNAATGEYVDMLKEGIIDPVKVVRTALTDAASVAALMTTTEAMVVEIPEEKKELPSMGGGMGGMGGMY